MTARPLAALTLAPAAPARKRRTNSETNSVACAAPTSAAAQAPSPSASTSRSPRRSAKRPHGSSVNNEPSQNASRAKPTLTRLRSNSLRIAGASTGSPISTAANEVCAAVPAASTSQR